METTPGLQHPNDLADAWRMVSELDGNEVKSWGGSGALMSEETFAAPGEQKSESSLGDDLVHVEPNQYKADLDNRMEAENLERMKQSEAEVAEFERRLGLSAEEYWRELRDQYAQSGINLGLMPDVREMREYAQENLAQNVGGEQAERAELAVKAELGRMAKAKAEEVRRWQSEGKGLPVTFESEWMESGKKDMAGLLNGYYGKSGELGDEARRNPGVTEDEKVAWMMVELPQKPGTLNPVWVFKSNQGKFEGETTTEYYNRLKNYRTQDQMRDWQIEQDKERKNDNQSERAEERRAALEKGRTLWELGEDPTAKTYNLDENAFALEDPRDGAMKVLAVKKEVLEKEEAELAREQRERDSEGVEEAIQETDEEIARRRQERERAEREKLAEEVRKQPKLVRVIKKMWAGFVNLMKLDDTPEEDEAYYAEMERLEKEKAEEESGKVAAATVEETGAKMMKVDGVMMEMLSPQKAEELMTFMEQAEIRLDSEETRKKPEVYKSIREAYMRGKKMLEAYEKAASGEVAVVAEEVEPKPKVMELNGVKVELPGPEQIERYLELKREAELALASEKSLEDLEERKSIVENYQKLLAILDAYEKATGGDLSEMIEYQANKSSETQKPKVVADADEKIDEDAAEFGGSFNFDRLRLKGWFSGEISLKGLEELKATKSRLMKEMFDALEKEDNEGADDSVSNVSASKILEKEREARDGVMAVYREKLQAIDEAIKWLEAKFGVDKKVVRENNGNAEAEAGQREAESLAEVV